MLTPTELDRLRAALIDADFTAAALYGLIGEEAHRALLRGETTPAERAVRGAGPLATLVRLFTLQRPVAAAAVDRALPGLREPLSAAGVLDCSADEVRARVDLRPYGDEDHDWWAVCDLTPGLDGRPNAVEPDHVLGISEASSTLAQLTVRRPAGRALDLGTGCGVQALHLAGHCRRVTATDVNPRALRFAAWTARLAQIDLELREGSLYEPVAEGEFDLIVSNPPFVVSPPGRSVLTYRDSGLPGDEVVRRVVVGAGEHLAAGGIAQVLANWVHVEGEPWEDRLAAWTEDRDLDVWAVQREVLDPAAYVELWLADAGLRAAPDYRRRYDAWLSWFEAERIEAVGLGWITLRRPDRARAHRRFEDYTAPVAQPLGETIAGWLDAVDGPLAAGDLAGLCLERAADVAEHRVGVPGAEQPARITLRQEAGMRREREVDTLVAGLVGACDGELSVGQILDALAMLLEREVDEVWREHLPTVRALIDEGFLR